MTIARFILFSVAMLTVMGATLLACNSDTSTSSAPGLTGSPEPTALPATPTPVSATSTPSTSTSSTSTSSMPTQEPAPPASAPPAASPTATLQPTAIPTALPPEPVTVTSSDGTEVVFETPPERIVVYDGAAVEMLFAIGQEHRIAGTHSYVTYPPETESIAKVGDAFNMDIEAIVALEPDLVYVFYDRFNADLERAGLKVLYLKSLTHGFTQVANQIRMWGAITGATENAERAASEFDARVAAIQEKMEEVEGTRTIYSHGFEWWTPGRNSLVNDVFELLKLENIADFEGYLQINPEVIVASEPDIIMADSLESVADNEVLSTLQAVESPDQIFVMSEGNSFSVAGPRFIDAVEEMAAWVYPELFP